MTMSDLSLSELKRLSPPFADKADEEEAFHYWMNQTVEAKLAATTRLTIEHYRELGVDVDMPMDKTIIRRTVPWARSEGN
jgi:hypothetical protein